MTEFEKSHQEPPSTYFVQDRTNRVEMERLYLQDQLFTASMDGVLPDQEHPEQLRRVLDVGCGTGGWLIATAQAYPQIELLIGVDISPTMLEFARAKAQEAGVADRVEFQVGDALRMLEFPDSFFDLVNQRAGLSFLRTWDWSGLLQEYQRVTRPQGIIRITEGGKMENIGPALTQFFQLLLQTLHLSGNYFEADADSVINHLVPLMQQAGIRNVQTHLYTAEYRAGTLQGKLFSENNKRFFYTIEPFMRRWIRLPDDYQELCLQATEELERQDFVIYAKALTAWGNPRYKKDVPVYGSVGR